MTPIFEFGESEVGEDTVTINGHGPIPLVYIFDDSHPELEIGNGSGGTAAMEALESVTIGAMIGDGVRAATLLWVDSVAAVAISPRVGAPDPEFLGEASMSGSAYPGQLATLAQVQVDVFLEEWAYPFTYLEFIRAIGAAALEGGLLAFIRDDEEPGSTGYVVLVWDDSLPFTESVAVALRNTIAGAQTLIEKTLRRLTDSGRVKHALETFSFPVEVRAICEQYLVFFAEFLREIGIKATSSVVHDGETSILQVVPADGPEALSLIHQALADYLSLVDSPTDAGTFGGSIAEYQLAAQVQHLQSQLSLAAAVLQAKNATIELKDATIARLKLSAESQGRIALAMSGEAQTTAAGDTLRPVTQPESLWGLVEFGTYTGPGLRVHAGEVIRRGKLRWAEWKANRSKS